jgi:NAD(P)-dependent dehydrogenase (short-subunit alcohol dehydrogenase family)
MDYQNLFNLKGRTALVIGAASGIGREAAKGLAAFGADVACADLNEGAAALVAGGIRDAGGKASAHALDFTDRAAVDELVRSLPRLDVLVATPSINVRKPLLDVTGEEFDRVVNVNLKGSFFTMTAAGRRMAAQGSGSIIVFSSIRSEVVEPGQGVYAATKAGTLQMIRALAAELGPLGVRANAIAPGVVETPLTEQIKQNAAWYNAYAQKSVLGRWSQPSELVGAVIFLASEASSYVTGTLLKVDGGWTAADGRFVPPL